MCDYCNREMRGVFNWHCRSCRARWYLYQPKKQQGAIAAQWRREMGAEELAEIERLIKERRAKVEA